MRISACVIVKNEEKNLPRWAESVRVAADEMIVVDTGSADKTVALAESFGAKVFHFAWRNDFAAAKNFAIGKATGDWILFLDADEAFSEEARGKVRSFLEGVDGNRQIIGVESPLWNVDADDGNRVLDRIFQRRIFRRLPDLRYRGRIHEDLFYDSPEEGIFAESDLLIYHTGYSPRLMPGKTERNLAMLQEEMRGSGESMELFPYLATTYYHKKDYDKTVYYARRFVESKGAREHRMFVRQYGLWLLAEDERGASEETKEGILRKALAALPDHPDFLAEQVIFLSKRQDHAGVVQTMERLLERMRDKVLMKKYDSTVDTRLPFLHYLYGVSCAALGEREKATESIVKALRAFPYKPYILKSFLSLFEGDRERVIPYLLSVYNVNNGRDRAFLDEQLAGDGCEKQTYDAEQMAECLWRMKDADFPGLCDRIDELSVLLLAATKCFHAGQYSDAILHIDRWRELYRAISRLKPNRMVFYAEVSKYQGIAYYKLGELALAQRIFSEYGLGANDEETQFYYGNTEYRLGNYGQALAKYENAIRIKKSLQEAFINSGLSLCKLGYAEEARKLFADADESFCREIFSVGQLKELLHHDISLGEGIDIYGIPIFINSRDRMDCLRQLVSWLSGAGYRNVYVLDNASTYPRLLEYYEELEQCGQAKVIRLEANLGHTALWNSGILNRLQIVSPYVYTDSDVLPGEECPMNVLQSLVDILVRHPYLDKVGLGLRTDDITFYDAEKVQEWESRFYRIPLEPEVFFGAVDTTFALYRNIYHYSLLASARTTGNLTARHLPWYYDYDHLPEDEAYYMKHANQSSTVAQTYKSSKRDSHST